MEANKKIQFNQPYMTGKELDYIADAHYNGRLAGDGPYTRMCHQWLEENTHCEKALLTHSCTAALEMSALLIDVKPGDEIIMPSYTFVSTANAFVLRGGIPVFVDIRPDTLNIDENLIESAITERTKAVVPVHYAGVPCEMNVILSIAEKYKLYVIEDAAQGLFSSYDGRPLGSLGDLSALSFHETKNVISGEGGALLINDTSFINHAEMVREKGTDRSRLFRGEVDKYSWQTVGSSYLPGELIAAFLWAQFEKAQDITKARLLLWERYHQLLEPFEQAGLFKRPSIPLNCRHNAHMYYVLVNDSNTRARVLNYLKARGILAIFHYIPLHDSPAGKKYARVHGSLEYTSDLSDRIIRLPLWIGLTDEKLQRVVDNLIKALTD